MAVRLTSKDYVKYINLTAGKIEAEGEYITALDSATGDGDHWINVNSGFRKLVSISGELESLSLSDMFKKIGMTLMSAVGGSSGVLYGSAYLAAAKAAVGKEYLDISGTSDMLEAMVNAIMERGNAKPGQKTMVDALYPAVDSLKKAISGGKSEPEALEAMKQAAIDGASHTKDMEAVRGRACYQANKGLGHLDPGAVTMSYQIACLADFVKEKVIG